MELAERAVDFTPAGRRRLPRGRSFPSAGPAAHEPARRSEEEVRPSAREMASSIGERQIAVACLTLVLLTTTRSLQTRLSDTQYRWSTLLAAAPKAAGRICA